MGPPGGLRGRSHFGYIKPAENLDPPRRNSPTWGYLAARRITAAPSSDHCGPDPDFARVWWRICAVGEVDLMLSFWVVVTW